MFQFNQAVFDQTDDISTTSEQSVLQNLQSGQMSFGSFLLGLGNGIIITNVNYDDEGDIDLNTFQKPRNDGGGVLSKYYRGHSIRVRLTVTWSTPTELQNRMDALKEWVRATEGTLGIYTPTWVRKIRATITSLNFNRAHYNITFVSGVELIFTTQEPFFRSLYGYAGNFTASSFPFYADIDTGGTADSEPKIILVMLPGSTFTQFVVSDGSRSITVSGSFVSADLVVIDSANKVVMKNTSSLQYTGIFPRLSSLGGPVSITATGTGTADISIISDINYL